jgi:hypothetical protein
MTVRHRPIAGRPISRRAVLAGSAALLSAPLLASLPARRASAQTADTVSFSITNNTGSDTVYAFVTGQALNAGNALMLLEADGQMPYYPASQAAVLHRHADHVPAQPRSGARRTVRHQPLGPEHRHRVGSLRVHVQLRSAVRQHHVRRLRLYPDRAHAGRHLG